MVRLAIRFVVSALVLMVLSFILPGFAVVGFGGALLAAVVIALLGYGAEYFLGENASPNGRGVISFVIAAVVIYVAQFLVPDMSVSILGAALAAIVIGIVDLFIPTTLR
ncbi:phage holin family protein [Natranaerobius thermophilus]|uniref:Phage holin family protein n=1 Tax=Natranaerobius thermophilus (strain ATCC BAA-1301 / DSM 18059 / JW/NM-WN-LF) TaxID=457570 RepID=B2A4J0_NATTJ|nr:phage holin family protein [Natranaerobius thermophilus]ACB85167.1 conserved hypothetical protein [Natranaerobius thermophilus JW/NM-WN-LF]